MTSTTKSPTIFDAALLTKQAIRQPDQKVTLEYWNRRADRTYCLVYTGGASLWHRTRIHLDRECGDKLATMWKQNEYGRFVGARTLLRVVRDLTGTELRPQVEAARKAEAEAKQKQEMAAQRRRMALALREVLDVMADDPPEVKAARVEIVGAPVRALLNAITHADPLAAQSVAYKRYGDPRADD